MSLPKSVVTVGSFDGVHLGHQAILQRVHAIGRERGLRTLAMVLWPHPLAIIAPERVPQQLSTPQQRCDIIAATGLVDNVETLTFDDNLRHLTASQFMHYLRQKHNAEALVMGYDNTFGSDRPSSPDDYHRLGRENSLHVSTVPQLPAPDGITEPLSSSAIRRALDRGDTLAAQQMLGRHYTLSGRVTHGKGLAHTLGFPTANILTDSTLCHPANGVYAAQVVTPDGIVRRAVVNVGTAPTIGDNGSRTVEAHILDYRSNLYDSILTIAFGRRLRTERRFDSLDSLAAQIAADIRTVEKNFDRLF